MPDIIAQTFADILKQYKSGNISLSQAVEEIKEHAIFSYAENCPKCDNLKCYCVCQDDKA